MSPLAVFLFQAHRATALRFTRDWMRDSADGRAVEIVDDPALADSLYRTWHANTGEYLALLTKVKR